MPRDEEQSAEDEGRHDLPPTDRVSGAIATRKGDGEQDRARDEVPDGHREKRRKVANHDRERDEGRSPDEVDRSQSKPNPHAVSRSHPAMVPMEGRSAQVECRDTFMSRTDRARAARFANAVAGIPPGTLVRIE